MEIIAPMTHYAPINQLSKQLLHSIVKKVFLWVQYLGLDTANGSYEGLTWHFPMDGDCYLDADLGNGNVFHIEWDRNLVKPTKITGNHKNVLDIPNHLDWFVDIEKTIYDTMEKLAAEIDQDRFLGQIQQN